MPGDPSVGDVLLDRYELLEQIGSGGHGVVFRAKQLALDRQVAIKIVRSDAIAERVAERFVREAQVLKKLSHPNTVQTFDFGLIDKRAPFIVFELLKGEPLDVMLAREGALPAHRVARIAEQILKSLMEAHEHDVVHRDLKPANIFVCEVHGETDYVKVLDFGIAKALSNDDPNRPPTITLDGFAVGTPNYMAPEQVLSDGVGVRTDLYALGLVMAEMLAGRIIVESTTPQRTAMAQASNEPVELPTEVLQSPLGHLIVRAIQKKPDRRFKSAEQMLQMLKAAAVTPTAEIRRKVGEAAGAVGYVKTDALKTAAESQAPSSAKAGSRRGLSRWYLLISCIAVVALAVAFAALRGQEAIVSANRSIEPQHLGAEKCEALRFAAFEIINNSRHDAPQTCSADSDCFATTWPGCAKPVNGKNHAKIDDNKRQFDEGKCQEPARVCREPPSVFCKQGLCVFREQAPTARDESPTAEIAASQALSSAGPSPSAPPSVAAVATSTVEPVPAGGGDRFDESAAKSRLYPKVAGGSASENEIRMLRAICSRQGDNPCRNMASEKLKELQGK